MAISGIIIKNTIYPVIGVALLWWAGCVLTVVGLAGNPIGMGVAILRCRLYQIDHIINRTLVSGSLTVVVALVYVGSVVVVPGPLRILTGQESQLAVVISTLAIAGLFIALRRSMQSFVDRRFCRRKYDATKTLEAFGAKLRDETNLDAVSNDLVGVVRETMQPTRLVVAASYR